jgi:hypothetical protein
MSVIGTAWNPGLLEDRVIDALQTWMPSSLHEVCAQDETVPAPAPLPRSYRVFSEENQWPEQQLPAIVVVSPGVVDEPAQAHAGIWRAKWSLEVTAIVKGPDPHRTRRLAQAYWTAMCLSILQRRSLGDPYTAAVLKDAAMTAVPVEKARTLAGATALFHVEVQQMFSSFDGPKTPEPPDPMPETWPTVSEINIEIADPNLPDEVEETETEPE